MNSIFFFIPILLFGVPFTYAEIEQGINYDREIIETLPDGKQIIKQTLFSYDRIKDGNQYRDYVFTDVGNALEVKTANKIIHLDKATCGYSFYNSDGVLLFNDSIIAFQSVVDQYTWNAVTLVNDAACEAYFDEDNNALVAKKYSASVGFMEYKYIFHYGTLKTQLESTNLTTLTNRVFAFDQTIDLNSDVIKFGGKNRNLDNFNGQTFDRIFLVNNKAKVLQFLNGIDFDFDLGFEYLDSITVTDTGLNKSKLTFHYMRNNEILLPNETLVIDPTYSNTTPTDGSVLDNDGDDVCNSASGGKTTLTTLNVGLEAIASTSECWRSFLDYNTASIPDGVISVDQVSFKFEITSIVGIARNCDYVSMGTTRASDSATAIFNAITSGTVYVNNDATCASTGTNLSVDLGAQAVTDLYNKLPLDYFTFGVKLDNETLDTNNHVNQFVSTLGSGTPPPTLEVLYTGGPPADAVDDLSSPSQSFGSIDLLWTQPPLNGGNLSGYQINYTTPFGNPLTVLENNTGSSDTSATVSGLEIDTPYTFGVSAWTEGGVNATHPPMTWLNVTTQGNFTIGLASFNQTNTEVLPITFEEQAINSTATFLNVTYANTFTLACDFYYQFANNNRTYTGLTGTAVSTTLDETYFILTGHEDEIININCYDTITGTDADYVMVQSSFPLLDQINNFRNGTYGTMGLFGVFDFITIMVVIFSMIGLNRVNESVGAIFNIILLGTLAWFEIIELPTIIFGALTVVIIFIITSTKKN